ncbi:MAG: endo-1,4-beta-xylanase [Mangrovibacterium sp.]
MELKYIIRTVALAALCMISCDDQIMEWYKDPDHGEVTTAELPLALAEKITRYEALKTYTDFTLGVGIGLDLYMENETYRNLVNENFDEIAVGYNMKHAAMVKSDGSLNFGPVDALLAKVQEAGLGVYGHTLVWHQNQNASYLNGLIAPTIIPAPAGSNSLDLSGLQNGSFTGWSRPNPGAGISVVDDAGMGTNSKAVKMISSSSSSNPWNLQLITPDITIVSGHTYEISFYIRSEQPGKGRISFSGLSNNYPWKDWYNTGSVTEAFTTSSQWQQVKFTVNDFTGTTFKASFDMGYLPDVTYYIDVNNIMVIDQDAEPAVVNMVVNGTFDNNIDGWARWNGAEGCNTHVTGADAYQGGGAMRVVTDAAHSGNQWDTQIHSNFTANLTAGGTYTVTFMIRSEAAGSIRCSTTGSAHYQGDQPTTTSWSQIQWQFTADGGENGINLDLGQKTGIYYIDNMVVTSGEPAPSTGPTIIEKTDEEKAQIIGAAMEDWISQMVTHYKDKVHAWDVVNEPMLESGSVRDGNVQDPANDEFYWVKYMAKDYAVTAFNLARQYGNPDDKLFINDYNLEYSLSKCDGLIEYVQYIESKGATVDGIGTQMHLSIDSDKEKIAQMFQKLATTGKLIKITEFDIKTGTASPTADQYAQQAEMYQYVLDMYMKYIPAAQRYGVTVWGVSDNEEEHVNWIPNDAPNLWDADYARKHAYKGFADGLAGRDVSEDFTGELQY